MAKLTKRQRQIAEKVDLTKAYPIDEAVGLLSELSKTKFTESFDVSVNLGVDPRKSDQVVRGATTLPHGSGKTVRVAVFAQGDNADAATAAGADVVGFEDLADEVKAGNLNFDVVIATPDAMRVVGQLGKVLGPRGLMPNPKVGTVTMDVAKAVSEAKAGRVEYRVDKAGNIHCPVGRRSFDKQALVENVESVLRELQRAKPAASKGTYMQSCSISSTMSPSVKIDSARVVRA